MRVAVFFQSFVLCGVCSSLVAAEIPVADFTRHEQYRSVKISPNGEYLAATAIVNGQVVFDGKAMTAARPGKVLRYTPNADATR